MVNFMRIKPVALEDNILRLTAKIRPLYRIILWSSAIIFLAFLLFNLFYDPTFIKKSLPVSESFFYIYLGLGYLSFYMLIFGIAPCFALMTFTLTFFRYRNKQVPGFFRAELRLLLMNLILVLMIATIMTIHFYSTDIS